MAITPPSWAKNAVPTPNGWQDPRSGELLKSQRIGQADIDAYNGVTAPAPAPVAPAPAPVATVEIEEEVMQQLNEAPVNNTSIDNMTKFQLEALGREYGVELDRRKSKAALVDEVKSLTE
jgi:hypothetical protein